MAVPSGWRPAAFNQGWTYRDKVVADEAGHRVSDVLASRHRHSPASVWSQRLEAGQLTCNGEPLLVDAAMATGDQIHWQRPPWLEAAVPDQWETIHDDGDLLVINKPSGLPVMPGGGFLEHTLTALMEQRSQEAGESRPPRPVHRLGRFTSGLQVCARRAGTRASLSRHFRPDAGSCKLYLTWSRRLEDLDLGMTLDVKTDVIERPHPLLGWVWGPELPDEQPVRRRLKAHSHLTLLDRREQGDFLQVAITTGRPHQIRIHLAQLGSPLLGDSLYLEGLKINPAVTPGEGGYRLHAWRLEGLPIEGDGGLCLEAPLPADFMIGGSLDGLGRRDG
ncbi:RluA family pseudouridine synthase [Synechococcus sp. UW140]|uniref:pseudouridine synthase n=1 Tax=Synechococcus sp. UW140 TaxID=368503 RepID=UPI000E0ECD9F|nr:RluA family pseudouridine synthase [Synechococcus sp. UW140]